MTKISLKKIAISPGPDEQIIRYEWPYDNGANASDKIQKISTHPKEYHKCSW